MDIADEYFDEVFLCPFHSQVFIADIVPRVTQGKNASFSIVENGRPLAIVPFFIYSKRGMNYGKMSPMYCGGPVFSGEFPLNKKVKIALFAREAIKALMKERQVWWAQFRQNVFSQPPFKSLDLGYMVADLSFSSRSLVVDTSDLDAAYAHMESQSRGAIRRAASEETRVEVRPFAKEEDAKWVSEMHRRVYRSKGYAVREEADLLLWRSMTRLKGAYLFIAKNRREAPVAYALVQLWSEFAYYSTGGIVRDEELTIGSGNLLHWEIMRFLNRHGVCWYDMSHSGLLSKDEDKRKVAEFKRSLGAEEYPYIKGLVFRGGLLDRFSASVN